MIFGSRGATPNQPAGTIAYNGNPYQTAADGNFDEMLGDGSHSNHVAHEVGHLLGLPDEYKVVSTSPRRTQPLDGRRNTLMADGGRIDPALLKRLVNRLRNEIHNIPNCWRGTLNWTHVVANPLASATTTGRADLSLEYDGKGGLTGRIAGTHSTTSRQGPCSGSTTTPGGIQAKLVGSYTPGRDVMTVRTEDRQTTPMHILISCGGKPVVSQHAGFYEHYERALTSLRATGDGGFESSHDQEYRCEASSTCTTRITLKLRPPE